MGNRSPAQLYALVFGVVLVAVGILGFFYEASFEIGSDTPRDALLGIFDVNGWHNVVHLVAGAIGLAVAGNYASARVFALGYAIVYGLVTVLGFIVGDGDTILGLVPINTEDNILHLAIAAAGLAAYFATPARPAATAGAATA